MQVYLLRLFLLLPTSRASCVAEPARTPPAALNHWCAAAVTPMAVTRFGGALPFLVLQQSSFMHSVCRDCGTVWRVKSSPSLLQLPACRRRMSCSGWQTAPSAAAEEGCSAKPRRSKTGKVDNKTARLLWGFCQKVTIKLPSSCGHCHRFPRETAGRGRDSLKWTGTHRKGSCLCTEALEHLLNNRWLQKPWQTSSPTLP